MYYCMYLPDTKQETLNRAFAYILPRFPNISDGLHKCPLEQQQKLINHYTVHTLKWSTDGYWLGWGEHREGSQKLVPFPSDRLIIGEL